MDRPMPDEIDVPLVQRLIASQFPQWADLPISRVEPNGWDNRTFRLGENMSVRLPSHQGYAPQVCKEHRWLGIIAPNLPLAIPTPLEMGIPGAGYPWHWTVNHWIAGETAESALVEDLPGIAVALAEFLNALYQIQPAEGPPAGEHNHFRGGSLAFYENETREAIDTLGDTIDQVAATAVLEASLRSSWQGLPVWLHGDVSASNLLIRDGRLVAVIDFGLCGVGDPACDLVIAWTFFHGESRKAFRNALELDEDCWARARGWTLWKALITLAGLSGTNPAQVATAACVLDEILLIDA